MSPAARPGESRPGRIAATLRALGFTPAQLARRPRRLGLLLRWTRRPRLFKDAHLIAQSGLFDADHHRRLSPDIAARGANPLAHYVMRGGFEGRSPSPLFDAGGTPTTIQTSPPPESIRSAHYLRTATARRPESARALLRRLLPRAARAAWSRGRLLSSTT